MSKLSKLFVQDNNYVALADVHHFLDQRIAATMESMNDTQALLADEDYLKATFESFDNLRDALTFNTNPAPALVKYAQKEITQFNNRFNAGEIPSMESVEATVASLESVIGKIGTAFGNLPNKINRLKLTFSNDRETVKTIEQTRKLYDNLKSRLDKAEFSEVEINLAELGEAFVVGHKYATDVPAALKQDLEVCHHIFGSYSQDYDKFLMSTVFVMKRLPDHPEEAVKGLNFLISESREHLPQLRFPKKWRDEDIMLQDERIILKWPGWAKNWAKSWEDSVKEEHRIDMLLDQPCVGLHRVDQTKLEGNGQVTLTRAQVMEILENLKGISEAVKIGDKTWFNFGDHILATIGMIAKVREGFKRKPPEDANQAKYVERVFDAFVSCGISMDLSQEAFFAHALKNIKAVSRLLEKVLYQVN